jgi:2-keto-3-deoxy-L-rhamnonate aldolase RhmA
MTLMQANRTKAVLDAGRVAIGCGIQQFAVADIPAIWSAAGFDYAFIDLEHGAFDFQSAQLLIRACLSNGVTPIVRVGELLYSLVARVLDAGAQGVILPRVEDPRELEKAVAWTRFPPAGVRGFGIGGAQLGYRRHSFTEIITHVNSQTLVVMQIESATAVDRADELLSVPGVDVAMIGPADLSISLGIPGEFENPLLLAAIDRTIAACAKAGVVAGIQVRELNAAKKWIARGMRFVGCATDHILLLDRAAQVASELRRESQSKPI